MKIGSEKRIDALLRTVSGVRAFVLRLCARGSVSLSAKTVSARSTMPAANMSQKMPRQPAKSAMSAPRSGAVTGAMPWIEPMTLMKLPSSRPV